MSQPETDAGTDTEKRESAASNGPKKKVPHSTGEGKSRWPTYLALAAAVIAVAVAVAAWLRPAHSNTPSFNDQQTADAKKSMCTAYTSVHQAVVANTHMRNPHGDDAIGQLAVAANARLALLGGGQYLQDRLAANPATPADLAKAVTSMAATIEDLGVGYLSGQSALAMDPMRNDLNSEIRQIDALCA